MSFNIYTGCKTATTEPRPKLSTGEIKMLENYMAANESEIANLKIDLQLFAEGDEPVEPGTDEPIEPAPDVEPVKEDITQTQAFSQRLKDMTQKAVDAEYDRLYGAEYGIHSKAEFDAAIAKQEAEREAQKKNLDPEVYQELQELKQFKNQTEKEKIISSEDSKLMNDPKVGELYKQWHDEIMTNVREHNSRPDIEFTIMLREKAAELVGQKPNVEELKQQAVKEYIENLKKGNKPVESGGASPVVVASQPKTFEEARKQAMEFMKLSKEF